MDVLLSGPVGSYIVNNLTFTKFKDLAFVELSTYVKNTQGKDLSHGILRKGKET